MGRVALAPISTPSDILSTHRRRRWHSLHDDQLAQKRLLSSRTGLCQNETPVVLRKPVSWPCLRLFQERPFALHLPSTLFPLQRLEDRPRSRGDCTLCLRTHGPSRCLSSHCNRESSVALNLVINLLWISRAGSFTNRPRLSASLFLALVGLSSSPSNHTP
ncbi:hypothetical protein CC2G_015289 [Coprinopsis cinerea AmutBmut pab1-1]|nr:hypothetical protein CC2G_015289 [Coprinopsis cinerea AmutBmut pab1-1]